MNHAIGIYPAQAALLIEFLSLIEAPMKATRFNFPKLKDTAYQAPAPQGQRLQSGIKPRSFFRRLRWATRACAIGSFQVTLLVQN